MASAKIAKELKNSEAAVRAAKGTAVTRVFGPIVDLGVGALNPENAVATTNFLMGRRLEKLSWENPTIANDTAEHEHARRLLNQSKYGELDQFLKRFE